MYPWLTPYQQQLPTDRLLWPQALLLAGSIDVGSLVWAHELAAFLLCHMPSDQAACQQCQSCHWLQAGHHPDFFPILKAEDEKTIKIDTIRDMIARLSKTAHSQAAQVVLLAPAESLNTAAANALLKSLEEPKARVHFILVADHHLSLPATIRSRCQIITLHAAAQQAMAWLKMQFADQSEETLQQILRLERGLPLAVARTLTQTEDSVIEDWLDDCIAVGLKQRNPLMVAQKWVSVLKEREIRAMAYFFQDIVRYCISSDHSFSIYESRAEQIERLATQFSLKKWLELCQSTWALYSEMIDGLNLNFQLSLECRLLALAAE